jgi:hypothetical protein
MRFEHEISDCARVRVELPAYLYEELGSSERAALEHHLESCAECRTELAILAEGRALLAHWQLPAGAEDPRAIARSIVAADRRSRRRRGTLVRTSALLSGAAAALLFVLALFQADMTLGQGQWSISFRLPGSAGEPARDLEARAREIVAAEFARFAADFRRDQDARLSAWSDEAQNEFLRLAQATDRARLEDQRRVGAALDMLTRESALEDLRTREALVQLASFVQRPPR